MVFGVVLEWFYVGGEVLGVYGGGVVWDGDVLCDVVVWLGSKEDVVEVSIFVGYLYFVLC